MLQDDTGRVWLLIDALEAAAGDVAAELVEAHMTREELVELATLSFRRCYPHAGILADELPLRGVPETSDALEAIACRAVPRGCPGWFDGLVTTLVCMVLLWEQERHCRPFRWLGREWRSSEWV